MNPSLRRTCLNQAHRELGARLVPFAGWEMPLHFGSQVEEHHAVRGAAGVFDVSHMLALDFGGDAAADFLRHVLSNDVGRLAAPGQALYTCLLNHEGGVIDDAIAYRLDDGYRLVINAGAEARDLEWLEARRGAFASAPRMVARRDLAIIALQGPESPRLLAQALPAAAIAASRLKAFAAAQCGEAFVARTGYTGEDGFEILLPSTGAPELWQALLRAGARPCGLGSRDTLRLEAGMALSGQDMDESVSPVEAGLAFAVALNPERDFVGRAALSAREPRFRSLGLVLDGGGVLRHGQRVVCAQGEGVITSGGFAPTLGRSVALARMPLQAAPGGVAEVEVRDRRLPVRVVKPPFVRRGQVLI